MCLEPTKESHNIEPTDERYPTYYTWLGLIEEAPLQMHNEEFMSSLPLQRLTRDIDHLAKSLQYRLSLARYNTMLD